MIVPSSRVLGRLRAVSSVLRGVIGLRTADPPGLLMLANPPHTTLLRTTFYRPQAQVVVDDVNELAIADNTYTDISYDEVRQAQVLGECLFLDVRTYDEVATTGLIPSAINIPVNEVRLAFSIAGHLFERGYGVQRPARQQGMIIVYCRTGRRAHYACDILTQLGYRQLRRYPESWMEWSQMSGSETSKLY